MNEWQTVEVNDMWMTNESRINDMWMIHERHMNEPRTTCEWQMTKQQKKKSADWSWMNTVPTSPYRPHCATVHQYLSPLLILHSPSPRLPLGMWVSTRLYSHMPTVMFRQKTGDQHRNGYRRVPTYRHSLRPTAGRHINHLGWRPGHRPDPRLHLRRVSASTNRHALATTARNK